MSVPARFKLRVLPLELIMDTLVKQPQIGAPPSVWDTYGRNVEREYERISNHHTVIDPEYLTLEDVSLLGNEWEQHSQQNLVGRFASLNRPVSAIVAGFHLSYKIREELWLEHDGHSETGTAWLSRPESPMMKEGHILVAQRKTRRSGRRKNRRRSTRKL
jgi:hypothetical protein